MLLSILFMLFLDLFTIRKTKNLFLESSRDTWNQKFLEDFTTPFHMAVSYSNKEELSQLKLQLKRMK